MTHSVDIQRKQHITQLINTQLANYSQEEKQQATVQLEEFLNLAASIIINSQSRKDGLEDN